MKKKKNKTKSSSSPKQINGSDSSTFHVSIASTAVAQICHSVGYKATKQTALQTLTNITVRYLTSLATSAAKSALSTGRTECNLYDVIRALEEVHADVGFKGNSAVTKRLIDSEMLKDVMRFIHWSREVPFAKPLVTSCGEKEVFTAVNEGKSEGVKRKEVVPRGKQMVTSLCEGEKKVFTAVNEGEKEKKVTRGKQMVTSLFGENNGNEELNYKAKKSYCGEKEVFTAVNEGESEGVKKKKEVVPRGRQVVTSLCENEKLNGVGKKSCCGEKEVFTVVNEGEKEKKVTRGKQKVTSLFGENNGNEKVPRGRQMLTSPNGETSHVPKWLPEFPKKSDCGEKVVFTEGKSEGKSEKEKVNYYKEVSELPEVRKKVRFEFRRGKDVNNLKFGVDLRSGVCKGGKRILCQIYEDGEKFVNGNGGGKKIRKGENDVVKKGRVKKKSARRYSGD